MGYKGKEVSLTKFIQKCREVEILASKGPWHVGHIHEVLDDVMDIDSSEGSIGEEMKGQDVWFILYARNNWLTLVDKLEEAVKVIEFYASEHMSDNRKAREFLDNECI